MLISKVLSLTFVVAFARVTLASSEHISPSIAGGGRLDHSLTPLHYLLELTPVIDPEHAEYLRLPGAVAITVRCNQAAQLLVLHYFDSPLPTIQEVVVRNADGTMLDIEGEPEFNNATETVQVNLAYPGFTAGDLYTIHLSFVSRVGDDRQNGVYLSTLVDGEVESRQAVTHFHPTGARMAFPCFDEPQFRTTFQLSVGRRLEDKTFSNKPLSYITASHPLPGYVWDVYVSEDGDRLSLPTYLIAFHVASDYEASSPGNRSVKLWAPASLMDATDRGVYAEALQTKLVAAFEQIFNVSYPVSKLDSIVVPEMIEPGTEYIGMNQYPPEVVLLSSEATTADKLNLAKNVAHEVVELVFGNYVTVSWWNDIWLSDSMAHYWMFRGMAAVEEEDPLDIFEPLLRTATEAAYAGMRYDGGATSTQCVSSQKQEDKESVKIPAFAVAHQKGSSLIRMLEGVITMATLDKAVVNYLEFKKYQSARTYEFLTQLTYQAHLDDTLPLHVDLNDVMTSWLEQAGVPLVTVSNGGETSVHLSQQRFANSPDVILPHATWDIPVAYTSTSQPEVNSSSLQPKQWLTHNLENTTVFHNTTEWLLVNPDSRAHYRVIYDQHFRTLLNLQLHVNHELFTPLSRAMLINDHMMSAFGEYITFSSALEFTKYLSKEDQFPAWQSTFMNLSPLLTFMIDNTDLKPASFEYFSSKIDLVLESLGYVPAPLDTASKSLFRVELVQWACTLGSHRCYQEGTKAVDAWISEGINSIHIDLQSSLYCAAVASGGEVYQNWFYEHYANATTKRQQEVFLKALSCPTDSNVLRSTLVRAINNEDMESEHRLNLIEMVASNYFGMEASWEFLSTEAITVVNSLVGQQGVARIVTPLSTYFNTGNRLNEFEQFLADYGHAFGDIWDQLQAAQAQIEQNIHWMGRHQEDLENFFL